MPLDPTVSVGNVITMGVFVLGAVGGVAVRSFGIGQLKQQFESLKQDLSEIKVTLKEQDKAEVVKAKAEALSDGVITLLQYRVTHLENELIRARTNIHRIANTIHLELLKHEIEVDSKGPISHDRS